ncbi:MAG: exodeoxyribonuclease V subunit gamma [Candidatus Omnitrophica bacterium]|nr:exodeoxyribonuclease V subunit gamma [Candidatus Omnitrophota bacterium]
MPALILIASPAGRGKTHYCLSQFKNDILSAADLTEFKSFLIVPTKEHADRMTDLVFRDKTVRAYGREHISTFDDFIHRFIKDFDRVFVTDVLRGIFIREILEAGQWEYFSSVRFSPGFADLLADFVCEVKESGFSISEFCNSLKKLCLQAGQKGSNADAAQAKKYMELAQILLKYDRRLEIENLSDEYDIARLFKEKVSRVSEKEMMIADNVYLDGFFELTTVQMDILKILASCARSITATVTTDDNESKERFPIANLFRKKLRQIGFKEIGLPEDRNHRTESQSLRFLETYLFSDGTRTEQPPVNDLEIIEAWDERSEIESAAREIRSVYVSGAYHFSDFCLIFRNIGSYAALVESVFEEFDLPVQIHERKMLRLDPLVSSLMSLLEMYECGWKINSVLRFLHSVLASDVPALSALIERHAFESGLDDGREGWLKKWDGFPGERENERFIWLTRWAGIEDELRGTVTADGHAQIMKNVLSSFLFPESLTRAQLSVAKSREGCALRRLFEVLDEIVLGFKKRGNRDVLFEEFFALLKRTVDISLYTDEAWGKNRVQVYDVSTARQKEYKVVFLCGLLEKAFPKRVLENPVLKDVERRQLNTLGRGILEERLPRQSIERYLFYLAVTRASMKLYLTYPRFNSEGTENIPSFYLEDAQRVFSGRVLLRRQGASGVLPLVKEARTAHELDRSVIRNLFEQRSDRHPSEHQLIMALLSRFSVRDYFSDTVRTIYANAERFAWRKRKSDCLVDEDAIKLLAFRDRPFSATRLETYAACPFRYYLAHEVGLYEPDEELSVRSVGNILHRMLEIFFTERGFEKPPEAAREILYEAFGKALEAEPLHSNRPYRLELKTMELKQIADDFLKFLPLEMENAPVNPYLFEHNFGKEDAPLEVVIDGQREDRIFIWGKIDRIDADPDRRFGVVIDYKLGKKLRIGDLEDGLLLQLPLYMLAVEQNLKLKVVGAYLFKLNQLKTGKSLKQGIFSEQGLAALGLNDIKARESKMLGVTAKTVFSEENFQDLMKHSIHWAVHYAESIRAGKFPVYPKDCLTFCKFKPVCRIEKWMIDRVQYELTEERSRVQDQ